MNGKRPITTDEYNRIHDYLIESERYRDLAMVSLCYHTGYRIKEVLSIQVKDILTKAGEFKASLYVAPSKMKKGTPRMRIAIREELRDDLSMLICEMESEGTIDRDAYLIQSQKGDNKAISYTQAYRIVSAIFDDCDVYDNVAVHSFRKAFCERAYKHNKNIVETQHIMGHSTPMTTLKYLRVDEEKLNSTILNM